MLSIGYGAEAIFGPFMQRIVSAYAETVLNLRASSVDLRNVYDLRQPKNYSFNYGDEN
jgi:hypothetical protein